ncbi:MAG: nucleotidyltransferase domain-containing protein [Planctomycetaceae bacterium]|jgi:predicted nucleotidyltransferase|nr:nucleotidyltransferase domain-containing protein [Planctomycetaceae bacterium]
MQPLPPLVYEIRDKILNCIEVERIYLFGSYAYGTPHKDSDFDFYVVLPDDCPMKPMDVMLKIGRSIGHTNFIPVDILANYNSRFDELSRLPTIAGTIFQKGIILYERPEPC